MEKYEKDTKKKNQSNSNVTTLSDFYLLDLKIFSPCSHGLKCDQRTQGID